VDVPEGEDADEEALAAKNKAMVTKKCNPYAIRSCLEALWYSYGHAMTPELPSKSLY